MRQYENKSVWAREQIRYYGVPYFLVFYDPVLARKGQVVWLQDCQVFRPQLDLSKSSYGQEGGFCMREAAVAPGRKKPESTVHLMSIAQILICCHLTTE